MALSSDGELSEAHLLKLLQQLCAGAEGAQKALSELHRLSSSFTRDHASMLRLGGIAKPLVKTMGQPGNAELRTIASELASTLATHDVPSAELLVREGLVKCVCAEVEAGQKDLVNR